MWSIDAEIRFDDAAAAEAARVVRQAVAALDQSRTLREHDVRLLEGAWEGYAQRWFAGRNDNLSLVATVTSEHLLAVAARIESARARAAWDRSAQAAARAARDEQIRLEQVRAEQARAEAVRLAAERDAATAKPEVDRP
jgi:hypothetical protein